MDTQFNWFKGLITSAIGLAMIAAFTFWQAQNDPLNSVI